MRFKPRHILLLGLALFLLADLLFSAYHYYNLPFDGDLTKIGGPFRWYEAVLKDPLGFKAVSEHVRYSGAGRYWCHAWTVWWCHPLMDAVRAMVGNPVVSLYLSTTLIAMLVHALLLWLVWRFVRVTEGKGPAVMVWSMALATVFVQYGSFYHSIGLVDRSPSYIFFYLLQMLFFALYLLPYYRAWHTGKSLVPWHHVLMIPGALYLAFSSVLAQPVWFVLCAVAALAFVLDRGGRWRSFIRKPVIAAQIAWMLLCCLYAFYVARFNAENTQITTLSERYLLLLKGVYYLFTNNAALFWMSAWTGLNLLLLRWVRDDVQRASLKRLALLTLAFAVLYTGLLPLGGYRSYRPFIVRYDTFMPVTLAWLFFLVRSSVLLWRQGIQGWRYTVVLLALMAVFTMFDRNLEKDANACQHEVLYDLMRRKTDTIIMPAHCNVGTWNTTDYNDPAVMEVLNLLFREWGFIQPHQVLVANQQKKRP